MRFAIVCLMAATAVSVSARYPSGHSKRPQDYGLYFSNSPSIQNVRVLSGEGDNNAHNRAIAEDTQINKVINEDGPGNRGPSGLYYGDSVVPQRVEADAGRGKNNHDNLASATGNQDNSIVNKNRPENPSGMDVPNSPAYQESIARVANGDNTALSTANQDNSLRNKYKSYINTPNTPLYQRAVAEAEGTDNDPRERLAVAKANQDNSVYNGPDQNIQVQNGTAIATGHGNFKSKATVNNKQNY
ncbi:uncharacterized protein LOC130673119 [Microplitis mediator]|uniref:uncharacterized protein LOC130673119 n=1 Tax=Microplitis mediator TaxID=375433 RepID=UPI0025559190|nr:uncharacterized protein LOC130673119 [Microplitis mediator]XP_057334034.1 uncharacterized protein LOC130673119 [Microplitis mediator]